MWVGYLAVVLAYLKVVCDKAVLLPLLVGCFKQFAAPSNYATLAAAAIGVTLHMLVVYPASLYCSSATCLLAASKDRKLSVFSAELIFVLSKVVLVMLSVFGQAVLPFLTEIYFLLYLAVIFKRPFYVNWGQSLKRVMLSVVAFVCLTRSINAITQNPKGAVLEEIAGALSFVFLVEWVSG
jgi:predicted neutral ceramidase superfamily lipid hydrolase